MLKDLIENERKSVNDFLDKLDIQKLQDFLDLLKDVEGYIIFSGVGKSGLIAEKIALTLTSTGTKAHYVSPINALHGDIGIVTPKDIFVMVSKSGESEELFNLVPFLRNKGVKVAAIVSNPHSRLARGVDYNLVIPHVRELCPFDLAPTVSTVCQLIVGDLLAVGLMEEKHFTLDDYARNHPSGRIGRRVVTRVKDLMLSGDKIPLASPEKRLVDVLSELSNKGCGCVLVIDAQQHLIGIFTDGDLRRAIQKHGAHAFDIKIEALMTKTPRSILMNDLAYSALQLMESDPKRPITVLAVLDEEQKVVGIIKMHDMLQAGLA